MPDLTASAPDAGTRPVTGPGGRPLAGGTGRTVTLDWSGYLAGWSARHGGYDAASANPVVRGWLRMGYGLARLATRVGFGPNAVTLFGLALSLAVPLVAGARGIWPVLAAALVLASAVADTVDGALAVATGRSTRLGYVYDALADRLSEAAWLVGLALLGVPPWIVGVCGACTWLHEYLRARAISAGMTDAGTVTVGERPTRIMVVAFALFFAGLAGLGGQELATGTATAAAAIWMVLGAVAVLQLLATVHQALR